MAYFILFTVMAVLSIGASDRGCGIKCFSFSCGHNKGGRCSRKEAAVYDNTVTGLCLHHTKNMKQRILDPMQGNCIIENNGGFSSEMMDKAMKAQEERILKDPNAFAKWMGRLMRKKT